MACGRRWCSVCVGVGVRCVWRVWVRCYGVCGYGVRCAGVGCTYGVRCVYVSCGVRCVCVCTLCISFYDVVSV